MITVYKTNVTTNQKALKVKEFLNGILEVVSWNFDLEDCDNILRIESIGLVSDRIICGLGDIGIYCVELK